MPGLVDGHMHPLEAGATLLKCSLNYASLTVDESAATGSGVFDQTPADGAGRLARGRQLVSGEHAPRRRDDQPCDARRAEDETADHRAFLVRPHGARELARADARQDHRCDRRIRSAARSGATLRASRPACSKMRRIDVFDSLLPKPTAAQNVAGRGESAGCHEAPGRHDVSWTPVRRVRIVAAFATLRKAGRLTARAHFAPVIEPAEAGDLTAAVARVRRVSRSSMTKARSRARPASRCATPSCFSTV